MKKLSLILCLLLCLGWLCACAAEKAPEDVPGEPLKERALPVLTREESLRMLCYAGANRALIADGRLYCLDYDADYLPVLAVYDLDGGLRRLRVLAEDCVPEYLAADADRLYYVNSRRGSALESVALDGTERTVLREGPCSWLRVVDGLLYYCGADGCYYSARPDGGGETRLLDEACAWPWLLDGALLYQSLDDERLHLYWPEDGARVTFTERPAAAPVLWGDRLYYSAGEELYSVGVDGLGERRCEVPPLAWPAELLPDGDVLRLRGITDDNGLKQWTALPEDAAGTLRYTADRAYRLCDYVGPDGRVDAVYNLDGRVRCFLYTDAAGHEWVYIAGRASG
ncbi:MAG: DUF5050 domain-containing protein [Oscillospiraceae bacterium]|nr:DUF5050 domain-containing protein [Oscillospiraceae bacterium]